MAEICFVTCHISDVMKNLLLCITTACFPKEICFSVCVSFMVSVFCRHRLSSLATYLIPSAFYHNSLLIKNKSFDANRGYVCHLTACYIFVGMFVVVGSVCNVVCVSFEYMFCTYYYVVRISRYINYLHRSVCTLYRCVFYKVHFHCYCYLYK